jgi:glycosyltransferase involved in cell wall biosynthesis
VKRHPLLCWIVVNGVPYHHARLDAAAKQGRLRVCLVQLTGIDVDWALSRSREFAQSFHHRTLFPNTRWQDIDRRSMVRCLHTCLGELRPDVVCVNGWSFGGGIAALSWCLAHQVPVVMMSESTAVDHPRYYWKEAIKRRIVRLCSASLVGGSRHRDYIAALGAPLDHVFTGYDAVDNEHFRAGADAARRAERQLRRQLGLPERYFMACSRLVEKKNVAGLLQGYALYRQRARCMPWSLVIVGDGELRDQLVALQVRLGLQEHVLFGGEKTYRELPIYYGLAGAFVHASTTEEWGLVVNEAMAAGLAALVSHRCGCAADLVVPGVNGLLFDPYDPSDMAAAMIEMSDGSCDRDAMGRASREIVGRWSPARFAEGLNAAVETALGLPRCSPAMIDRLLLWGLGRR